MYKLKLLLWEMTSKCNLGCQHCRSDAFGKEHESELSTEEIKGVVRQLLAFSRPLIILSGGEPLLRNDIFEIAKYIKAKNSRVSLATNGTLLTKDIAKKIRESGIEIVGISLDGKDSSTHDSFRKSPGAFNKVIDGIGYLKHEGVPFHINTTITQHNLNQIKEISDLSCKLEAESIHLFILVPTGCGKNISLKERIMPEESEKVLNYIYDYSKTSPLYIRPVCAPFYFRILKQRQSDAAERFHHDGFKSMTMGCLAAKGILFISSTGEVHPCDYMPLSAGNIRENTLRSLWEDSQIFNELRRLDRLKGKCGKCEFKFVCGGGCRARAYAETKDYLASDPYCIYEPA